MSEYYTLHECAGFGPVNHTLEGFRSGVANHATNSALRLVYADWLEERGDSLSLMRAQRQRRLAEGRLTDRQSWWDLGGLLGFDRQEFEAVWPFLSPRERPKLGLPCSLEHFLEGYTRRTDG